MKTLSTVRIEESKRFKPLKILYIHGIDSGSHSTLARLLRRIYGPPSENGGVSTPQLLIREVLFFSTVASGMILIFLVAAVVLAWFLAPTWSAWVSTGVALALAGMLFFATSVLVPRLVLSVAESRAMRAFETFRPNVIVALSFGAVVVFRMAIPKVPLLLLSPSQEAHRNFFAPRSAYSLRRWPYVLVVHGTGDSHVPIDDSLKLIETAKVGRGRLEVLDQSSVRNVEEHELKSWIDDIFERGREQVLHIASQGSTDVDPSLFVEAAELESVNTLQHSSSGSDSQPSRPA